MSKDSNFHHFIAFTDCAFRDDVCAPGCLKCSRRKTFIPTEKTKGLDGHSGEIHSVLNDIHSSSNLPEQTEMLFAGGKGLLMSAKMSTYFILLLSEQATDCNVPHLLSTNTDTKALPKANGQQWSTLLVSDHKMDRMEESNKKANCITDEKGQ